MNEAIEITEVDSPPEGFLSIKGIAGRYGFKRAQVYGWVRRHNLPHFRIGKNIYIRPEKFEAWFEQRKKGDHPEESPQGHVGLPESPLFKNLGTERKVPVSILLRPSVIADIQVRAEYYRKDLSAYVEELLDQGLYYERIANIVRGVDRQTKNT